MPSITVRVSDEVAAEVDEIASAVDRSRTWVVTDALERYLREEREWLAEVRAGLEDLDRGNRVSHEEVMAEMTAILDAAKART